MFSVIIIYINYADKQETALVFGLAVETHATHLL